MSVLLFWLDWKMQGVPSTACKIQEWYSPSDEKTRLKFLLKIILGHEMSNLFFWWPSSPVINKLHLQILFDAVMQILFFNHIRQVRVSMTFLWNHSAPWNVVLLSGATGWFDWVCTDEPFFWRLQIAFICVTGTIYLVCHVTSKRSGDDIRFEQ